MNWEKRILFLFGVLCSALHAGPVEFIEEFDNLDGIDLVLDRFAVESTDNVVSFMPRISAPGALVFDSSSIDVSGSQPWAVTTMRADLGMVDDFEFSTRVSYSQIDRGDVQQFQISLQTADGTKLVSLSIADPWNSDYCPRVSARANGVYAIDTGLRNCDAGLSNGFTLSAVRNNGVLELFVGSASVQVEVPDLVTALEINIQKSPLYPSFGLFRVDRIAFRGEDSSVGCEADLNDDGVLNYFDVSEFMRLFSIGCP